MPNGGREFGVFTPSEAAYTRPGAWETMARGEATKQAGYMSAMDRFYAELEEMERQFGERMTLEREKIESQEKMAGEQLSWLREQELGRGAEGRGVYFPSRDTWIGGEEEPGGRLGLAYAGLEAERYRTREAGRDTFTERAAASLRRAKGMREEEEGVSLDWLSEQLGLQREAFGY